MGIHAVRARSSTRPDWADIQVAYGGSEDAGNADTMVADLGPTGLPFVTSKTGVPRVARRSSPPFARSSSGAAETALVVGSTSISARAFPDDPATGRCRTGTAGSV